MQPVIDDAAAAGLLVGGTLRVCEWDGRWVPRSGLTLRQSPQERFVSLEGPAGARLAPPPTPAPTGDCCVKCGGSRMRQAGACKVCEDCGESGGCG
jgi:hypothetical protein